MTQLTDDLITFEVPEGAAGFEIDNPLSPGDLVYYLGFPSVFNFRKVSLPPGNWQFICTTKDITEQQASWIVGSSEWYFPARHTRYIDYAHPYNSKNKQEWSVGFSGSRDSLRSLLTSKGLDPNNNHALLKKG